MSSDFEYKPDLRVMHAARSFIRTLCKAYGNEKGMKAWDNIRNSVGEQIASDIFFGMLSGHGDRLIVSYDPTKAPVYGSYKIEAIKEIRGLTGMGLKESKDFVEDSMAGRPQPIDMVNIDDPERVTTFIEAMARLGFVAR
jgi:hypothetical protein